MVARETVVDGDFKPQKMETGKTSKNMAERW